MFTIKIDIKKAQEYLIKLKDENNLDNKYRIKKTKTEMYIPVLKITPNLEKLKSTEKLEKQKNIKKKYKDILLENGVPKEVISNINTAYDIVGDIIIIAIDEKYKKYYTEIGKALLSLHSNVKTVLNKIGEHKGVYRTQDMKIVFGEDTRETIIKENKCKIKIDVEKVFCSTRLSEERKRILEIVKENETIGVFFAGAGPFALAIAKNKKIKEIIAIELNEVAISYLKENIKLNKLEDKIAPVLGDVNEETEKYPNYFDRIVMPLPKSADQFLESAIYSVKNKGNIHIYKMVPKDEPYKETEKIIEEIAKKNKVKISIINKKIIMSYSPSIVQIVMDLQIEKLI